MIRVPRLFPALCLLAGLSSECLAQLSIDRTDDEIRITTDTLRAAIRRRGYVTGVAAQSFVDLQTGFRDAGFGLDIVDWIMEPGSDEAYRDRLDKELVYEFGNLYHGKTPKRSLEGPQICTQARRLEPEVTVGSDFVGVRQEYRYRTAAPGKRAGSLWKQTLVFPAGKRYFVSCDRIESVNDSNAMFLRLDMPGHLKHRRGDSFSKVYLSYAGELEPAEFERDFAPDEKFNYTRDRDPLPERFIRAYRLRDPDTGKPGPWLAGMTLAPEVVSEARCHQRGYICMIEEFGGRPIKAGEACQAAFIVGYFDSIEEMHAVYDAHRGKTGLTFDSQAWKLTP